MKNVSEHITSMNRTVKLATVFGLAALMGACQGQISEKTPVHPNMNMDQQERKEAQEANSFFDDGRSMRQPVAGTVARGLLKEDDAYYRGVDANGDYIDEIPVEVTKALLYRGKERYEIFCTPCHGITGEGNGIVTQGYGYTPVPTYHQQRLQDAPDGELYSAIANGVRTMPNYATQVPVDDRWAIVAYIRALQASQNVSEEEIQQYDIDIAQLKNDFAAEEQRQAALAEARQPQAELTPSIEMGANLYVTKTCQACHSNDGTSLIGPTFTGVFGTTGEVVTAAGERITITKDEAYIKESILEPNAKKSVGFENGVMVALPLTAVEVEALILYIKSLADN